MRRPLTPTQRVFVPPTFRRALLGLALGAGAPFLAAEVAMYRPLGQFPTVPFFVAVVVATVAGRLSAGLLATGTSVLLLDYWFTGPTTTISLLSLEDVLALVGFAIVALVFALILARRDVATAQAQAEGRRLEFLTHAGDVLTRTLDFDSRIEELTRLVVPEIADWCTVHMADDVTGLRLASLAHADASKVEWAREIQARYPTDPDAATGVPQVIRTGRSELFPRITRRLLRAAARDEEHLRLIQKVGFSSAIIAPIAARGRVIGAISLIAAESKRRYGPADRSLAEELGARAGLAIENARLYQERDHIAATLQRALLPPALPTIAKFDLSAFYRPAVSGSQVGGDFYDVFAVANDSWLLVMGDACGKGPEAAAVTGLVRYTIRALAARESSPAEILTELNETLFGALEGDDFATVAIAHLVDAPGGARLTVSCGGHPPPVVLREDGSVERVGEPGVIVGAFGSGTYRNFSSRIRRGETAILYTDGLTSKHEGDAFADGSRLRSDLANLEDRSPDAVLGLLRERVTSRGEGDPHDDVAVLAVRPTPARRRKSLASVMSGSSAGTT